MLTTMVSIAARITALELAVIAVAKQELGDSAGHPFRGNQYGGGGSTPHGPGSPDTRSNDQRAADNYVARDMKAAGLPEMDRAADALRAGNPTAEDIKLIRDQASDVRAFPGSTGFQSAMMSPSELQKTDPEMTIADARSQAEITDQAAAHYDSVISRYLTESEPLQRHGLAQDRSSYDTNDAESFSIDDDGTVTFGDSPGHPFRGNQYAGGMSHEEAHTRAENHGANFQREHPDVAKQVGREATRYLDRYMNDSPNTEASSTRDQMLNRYRATDNGTKIGPASTPSGYLPHNPVQTYASPLASGAARMQQGTASDSEVRAVGNFMRRTEETQ